MLLWLLVRVLLSATSWLFRIEGLGFGVERANCSKGGASPEVAGHGFQMLPRCS